MRQLKTILEEDSENEYSFYWTKDEVDAVIKVDKERRMATIFSIDG